MPKLELVVDFYSYTVVLLMKIKLRDKKRMNYKTLKLSKDLQGHLIAAFMLHV
jgi:hypothetical protein